MANERRYYADSYTTHFDAHVIETTHYNGLPAVVLDQTYFYPTSGGQPHDTGVLNDTPVSEVAVREDDGAVVHMLEGELAVERVTGQINWARRLDHMQHHTGQHILSQAFIQVARAHTIGFHMSPDSITIDLDQANLEAGVVDAAEDLANRVVNENRPVRAWFPTPEELATLQLRKVPDVDGTLRVVDIGGFDTNACGGTHVAHTGEIGIIKVLRVERRGEALRVEFRCGTRALQDYRTKNNLLQQLSAELTTSYHDIPTSLNRLRDENKSLNRELRVLRKAMLEHEVQAMWKAADHSGASALVAQVFDGRDAGEVRGLVQQLIEHPSTVVICAIAGEKAHLITARSDDLPYDMVVALKRGLAVWGIERGGGRPSFAQGGGTPASLDDAQKAIEAAIAAIRSTES
ncbi:MAG: alanyl-tRNA editing protein [Chloroflexi bacterium]|nr:alanyl-tRNA editing protein [Chloroflexota bacterium]